MRLLAILLFIGIMFRVDIKKLFPEIGETKIVTKKEKFGF